MPGHRYAGPLGSTRRQRLLYSCPSGAQVSVDAVRGIDAASDPDLMRQILSGEPLNSAACPDTGERYPVEVSVVVHDPERELFVLVLPASQRHRELEARAELLIELAADAEFPVPAYVRRAEVVFGPDGLRERLAANTDERRSELDARERRLESRAAALERFEEDLERRRRELDRLAEAGRESSLEDTSPLPPPHQEPTTSPFELIDEDEITDTGLRGFLGGEAIEIEALDPDDLEDDEVVVADQMIEARMREGGATQVGARADSLIERWIASREPSSVGLDDSGRVRVAVSAPSEALDGLLSADLKVLLQLHRLPTYPLITLSVGTRESFNRGRPGPATLFFDVGDEADRAALSTLAADFSFQLDLFDTDYLPVRKRTITAGLAANVQYLLTAADDQLARIDEGSRSLSRALIAYDDPAYDRFGREHPERGEFREEVLADASRPSQVRWALHVCRRFSTPEGEEYLLYVRGYPLRQWHKRRAAILERALELGLWMGNTLSRIAVREGLAASRQELVTRSAKSFVNLVADTDNHDLDSEAVRDNWKALTEQLRDLGLDPDRIMSPRTEPIDSGQLDSASGTIGHVTALIDAGSADDREGSDLETRSTDELVSLLSDRERRYRVAIALCRRGEPATVRPVFSALRRMTRAEAGHVFGNLVSFGERAIPHLIETLGSRKGFLRQGAALALAALRADAGLEPVCELLLSEPTEIWKEVARALGEYGADAVMPVVARLREQPDNRRERVAWALAHIASRGGRHPVETLAGGRDPVAAGVARHALELAELAGSDNRSIWSPRPGGREHTVKRAFSRRVLQALPRRSQGLEAADRSRPALRLSEADLIEAGELDDDIEPLDESDLLPS